MTQAIPGSAPAVPDYTTTLAQLAASQSPTASSLAGDLEQKATNYSRALATQSAWIATSTTKTPNVPQLNQLQALTAWLVSYQVAAGELDRQCRLVTLQLAGITLPPLVIDGTLATNTQLSSPTPFTVPPSTTLQTSRLRQAQSSCSSGAIPSNSAFTASGLLTLVSNAGFASAAAWQAKPTGTDVDINAAAVAGALAALTTSNASAQNWLASAAFT